MNSKINFFNFLLILLTVNFCLFTFSTPVYAHVLKTDGTIGAVLHVDPEDDPIAGAQSGFFFEFKDKEGKFAPQNCDCTFSIIEDGKQIFSQPLFQNNPSPSLTSASIFFTFPEKNVYQVKVVGKSNTPGSFQHFTLLYDIRVARESDNQPTTQNWILTHIPLFIGAIIVVLLITTFVIKERRKK